MMALTWARALVGALLMVTLGCSSSFFVANAAYAAQPTAFSAHEIKLLVDSLESKEWTRAKLHALLNHPSLKKLPNMFSLNVTKPIILKKSTYAHFAEPPAIGRAVEFFNKWQVQLAHASQLTGVDAETIVAILLVETNLGTFTGKHHLMSIYPSIYVDATHLLSDETVKQDSKLLKRATSKRGWAHNQMKALLSMHRDHRMDIMNLNGSYAGAIGICQFLPSSYLGFAKSATSSFPNLFEVPDAALSVGNYLKKHGYKTGIDHPANKKAVYSYNHSDVYVDIVLKAAKTIQLALQNLEPKPPQSASSEQAKVELQ